MRLAYLVHDLADPAVTRRLDMLRPHLTDAVVLGFHRGAEPPATVAGWPAVPLGRTHDARLAHRLWALLRARAALPRLAPHLAGRDCILSRQLETLVLARAGRDAHAPGAALVQECLDVHRLLLSPGPAGRGLRWLEGRLLRACQLLIISSPGFLREYLGPTHGAALPPVLLVENKVLAAEAPTAPPPLRPAGPPWRIGWFGMLRCRRSLLLLAGLARALPGRLEIDLRGRPAVSAIPDFDAIVAGAPGLRFGGGYDRRHDLAGMYGAVHYSWTVDFFEAGGNSDWLLPNRLYEGSLHGAVPIALAAVETGRWLAGHDAGLLLHGQDDAALAAELAGHFAALDPPGHAAAAARLGRIPTAALLDDGSDAKGILAGLAPAKIA